VLVRDAVEFDDPAIIPSPDLAIADAFNNVRATAGNLRKAVTRQCARPREKPLEDFFIITMCENRRTFGGRRSKPTGVVEVRMGVDDEADRLVRYFLFCCRHHRQTSRVALAAFDNENMVAHVNREGRVVSADPESAVT